ncbi:PREDICTED: fibroblast growth factor 19 [Capra hircus]|nr:PREDICTED: fibroblast growth factor 19 [Capra hircus]
MSGPGLRAAPASARRLVHSRGKGVEANGLGTGVMVGSAVSFISLHNQTRPDGSDLASPQRLREELRSFQRKRASFSSRSGAAGPPPSLPHPHHQICAQSSEPEGGAMRSSPSRRSVARALVLAGLWLAAAGRPLAFSDAGPHVHYGWGESVRLRHLYTAGPQGLYSCFLRIHSDGAVDCAQVQSAHSLMEIRAVALSTVAIKGERSVLFLCMDADGKMQGLTQYSAEDCAFEEEIRPDGYNMYWSRKHHLPVSLSSSRQRQLFKSRGFLPLSHFLPMLSTIPAEPEDLQEPLKPDFFLPLKTDSMDPFGLATKLGSVKSPSFYS